MAEAVAQIDGISEHLPFTYPPAEVAIVNHQSSQELFGYNGEDERFVADVRGVFRTLWNRGVPTDIVTPAMDWSKYKLLFLPNVTLMEDDVRERIERTLADSPDTRLVAEGTFGMYSTDGQTSYRPPEGLADLLGVRVADVDAITGDDITAGCNVLETDYGAVNVTTPCGYAKLQPSNGSRSAASLNGSTVAVSAMGGRFTWFGLTLSAGFGNTGNPAIVEGLLADAGVSQARRGRLRRRGAGGPQLAGRRPPRLPVQPRPYRGRRPGVHSVAVRQRHRSAERRVPAGGERLRADACRAVAGWRAPLPVGASRAGGA